MTPAAIAELLPDVVRRTATVDGVLDSLLGVMAALHQPVDEVLVDFDRFVDPYRCPAPFVPYLAEWVGLAWLVGARGDVTTFPTGDGPLRHIVASAESLAKERGTAVGLRRMLVLATGQPDVEVTVADRPAFHIVVSAPESTRTYHDLLALIIRHEKPAFVTADLAIGDDPPTRLGPARDDPLNQENDHA